MVITLPRALIIQWLKPKIICHKAKIIATCESTLYLLLPPMPWSKNEKENTSLNMGCKCPTHLTPTLAILNQ
jgi:hypothetical protein